MTAIVASVDRDPASDSTGDDQSRFITVRSMMTTNLKVILTTIGVGILASPAAAQSEITRPYVQQTMDNGLNPYGSSPQARHRHPARSVVGMSNARGSVDGIHDGNISEGNKIRSDDCVHVLFPQCSGGG
jgi:hypothetical protein